MPPSTGGLVLADSGRDAAARRYREVCARYYGTGSYDFSEGVLTEPARAEARAGRTDNALGLLGVNAEYNPASAGIALAQGDVYRQRRHGRRGRKLPDGAGTGLDPRARTPAPRRADGHLQVEVHLTRISARPS